MTPEFKKSKYILFGVLICALFLLLYFLVSAYLKVQKEKLEKEQIAKELNPIFGYLPKQEFSYTSKDTINITSTIEETKNELPKTAKVYKYKVGQNLTTEDAKKIAVILGITANGEELPAGNIDFYGQGKKSALSFWQKENRLNYYNKEGDFQGNLPSLENAINASSFYLLQFGLKDFNLIPSKEKSGYRIAKNEEYPKEGSLQNYDSIAVFFQRNLEGFPTTSLPYQDTLVYFLIGPKNIVLNMSLYYAPVDLTQYGVYQIKDVAVASKEAVEGKGEIVNLKLPDNYYFNIDFKNPKIDSVSLNNFDFVYLDRQGLDYLQPVFVFSGTASVEGLGLFPVTLYVGGVI